MTAEIILDRLEGIRQAGDGRWMAKCPAHEDRSPSLSIRETSDGTVLIRCFAGCGAADVVAAVGLALADLFPEKLADHRKKPARDFRHVHAAREALKCLTSESLVLLIAARALAEGKALDEADQARLEEAVEKIARAREVAA